MLWHFRFGCSVLDGNGQMQMVPEITHVGRTGLMTEPSAADNDSGYCVDFGILYSGIAPWKMSLLLRGCRLVGQA